ncbi:Rho GTPase-activating protein gacZ, partial [Pseudocercospora fuligena]
EAWSPSLPACETRRDFLDRVSFALACHTSTFQLLFSSHPTATHTTFSTMATPKLLDSQCSYCETKCTGNLCAGCKVVRYCSKEHQTEDWPRHKSQCTVVKKTRSAMDREERKLHEDLDDNDPFQNGDPFETGVGHFWGLIETRSYMKIKTKEAVQVALDQANDCFRLCHSDNMGVRDMAPALMIRLGKDQQAYDFLKWHCTTGQEGDYDWGDMSLPYLDLKDENVMEALHENMHHKYGGIAEMAAMTLIKLRLLFDIRELEQRSPVGEKVPQEILDLVREQMASDIISRNESLMSDIRNGVSLKPHIQKLEGQLDVLFQAAKQNNECFWPAIVNPGSALTARPATYSMGSREEMELKLQYLYEAWEETPGAVEWVKQKLR